MKMKDHEMHELIEIDLMDAYYGEKELSDALKKHLAACPQCASFWEKLHILDDTLSVLDTEIEVDERVIRRALSEAGKIKAQRSQLRDLAVFLCIAVSLLGLVGWLAYLGYGVQILKAQVLLMMVAPVSIPLLFWRRLKKEV